VKVFSKRKHFFRNTTSVLILLLFI